MKKRLGRITLFVVAAALVYFLFSGKDGLIGIYGLHRETQAMQEEMEQLDKEIDSLRAEIRRLQSDTAYIEKIAREKLGMARENERVYIFTEDDN